MCQYHQAYLESQANINHNQDNNNNNNNHHHNHNQNNNNNNLSPYLQQQTAVPLATNGQQHQNLIVCPKASQYNNLPVQFASINTKLRESPAFERHQRDLLKSLNASFTNYLQLNSHQQFNQPQEQPHAASNNNNLVLHQVAGVGDEQLAQSAPAATSPATGNQQADHFVANDLIDDELLNEIISPLIVDEAYVRAKELIVKRRKLENELIRQGEY